MKETIIAVVGATGLVGSDVVTLLEELKVPVGGLKLFASEDSAGEIYKFGDEEVEIGTLKDGCFEHVGIAVFACNAHLSSKWVPEAVKAGAKVIDISGGFSSDLRVPSIVFEINLSEIQPDTQIISIPCSTVTELAPVLECIHKLYGLRRVVVSTYEAVSGAGRDALDELWSQTLAIFNQKEVETNTFQHQIAFSLIPQVDIVCENGYTRAESRLIEETKKVLGLSSLAITATSVRVPVLYCHGESVNVETEKPLSVSELMNVLSKKKSINLYAEPDNYPMPLSVTGTDEVHIGRIRRDNSVTNGVNFWIVADNVRQGVALNTVNIIKHLCSHPE